MRKADFAVPTVVMAEFAQELTARELDNRIVGVDEDDDILIEVIYEKTQEKVVDQLETIFDELCEQIEDEEGKEDEMKR